MARAGLDTPWQVTVTRPGGLGKQVTLAITGDYFTIFETQGFHPEPADETRNAHTLYLTFTAPPGVSRASVGTAQLTRPLPCGSST